jgi:hypothetical protein
MRHILGADDLTPTLTTDRWPRGIYGDTVGGKSFTDRQSEALEASERHNRPNRVRGWYEIWVGGTLWTCINTRSDDEREAERDRAIGIDDEIRAALTEAK